MKPYTAVILGILAVLVNGCNAQPAEPGLIYNQEGCIYSGPTSLEQSFNINWTVEETFPLTAILEIVSIDEGKSLDDLENLPASDPPPTWVHKLSYALATQSGTSLEVFDLSSNAAYKGEPIYIVCLSSSEANALGAAGPFQIEP